MAYSTKQQQAVLACLLARRQELLSANELAEDLRASGSPVGLATIYRQLERLELSGRIHKVNTGEGAVYQYCDRRDDDSGCVLLKCKSCGRISHLDCSHLKPLYEHLARDHHFRIDPQETVFLGLCGECAAQGKGTT